MDIKEMIKKDIYEALKEYITIDDIIVEYPKIERWRLCSSML